MENTLVQKEIVGKIEWVIKFFLVVNHYILLKII